MREQRPGGNALGVSVMHQWKYYANYHIIILMAVYRCYLHTKDEYDINVKYEWDKCFRSFIDDPSLFLNIQDSHECFFNFSRPSRLPKLYINRRAAAEHRSDPSLDPDAKNSVCMQIFEGLKPRDNFEKPLDYRWVSKLIMKSHENTWVCCFSQTVYKIHSGHKNPKNKFEGFLPHHKPWWWFHWAELCTRCTVPLKHSPVHHDIT